jgi:hypothetical protein
VDLELERRAMTREYGRQRLPGYAAGPRREVQIQPQRLDLAGALGVGARSEVVVDVEQDRVRECGFDQVEHRPASDARDDVRVAERGLRQRAPPRHSHLCVLEPSGLVGRQTCHRRPPPGRLVDPKPGREVIRMRRIPGHDAAHDMPARERQCVGLVIPHSGTSNGHIALRSAPYPRSSSLCVHEAGCRRRPPASAVN